MQLEDGHQNCFQKKNVLKLKCKTHCYKLVRVFTLVGNNNWRESKQFTLTFTSHPPPSFIHKLSFQSRGR